MKKTEHRSTHLRAHRSSDLVSLFHSLTLLCTPMIGFLTAIHAAFRKCPIPRRCLLYKLQWFLKEKGKKSVGPPGFALPGLP
jgi:hypothetical protein